MQVIQTTAIVTSDGELRVQAPPGIASGEHKVVVILEELPEVVTVEDASVGEDLLLPIYDLGIWKNGTTLSREEIYDDWQ
jgi:hypothetical protein